VDKIEDGVLNSDEMISPAEASAPAEEPANDEVKPAKAHTDLFADEKTADKRSLYLVVAGAIAVPVVFLALASFEFLNFSTAVYIVGLCSIPLVLWAGHKTNTVYVVFLGIILAALMTCLYCLWVALAKYNFDVKAQEAKQRVGMVQPVDRGLFVETGTNAAYTFADC